MPAVSTTDPASRALAGTYLVTGGTRGIGRAISLRLARAGAHVVANYVRDQTAAAQLAELADRESLDLDLCHADITTPEGLLRVDAAVSQTGTPLHGFVHCAATGTHRKFADLTVRHLDWTMALNVRAFFELLKMLLPRFGEPSSIVALSSAGARRAVPDYTVVGASKAALESLVRHLAVELAPRGIRLNVLAPGAVDTAAWRAIPGAEIKLATAAQKSPLGRLVTLDEVADAALFLCSPGASGINGHTLVVDGGTGLAC